MKFNFSISMVVLLFFYQTPSLAQHKFQMIYANSGDENVAAVVQNGSGNFVLACNSYNSTTNMDIELVEVSNDGTILNSNIISTSDYEIVKSICTTDDGGYLVSGTVFTTASNYDWMVIKLDASFQLEWYRRLSGSGNDYANKCYEVKPGRYLVTGTAAIGGAAKPSITLLNDSGYVQKEFYLNTNQFASPDYKGWYLGDGLIGFSHLTNAYCIVDTNGTVLENPPYNFGTFSTAVVKSNNGYASAVVGDYGGPFGSSLVIGATNIIAGTQTFLNKYKINGYDFEASHMISGADGGYLIAINATSLSSGNVTPYLLKLDSTGATSWVRNYLPSSATSVQVDALIPTADKGYLIAGRHIAAGPATLFIAKTDSTGAIGCNDAIASFSTSSATTSTVTPHTLFTGSIGTVIPSSSTHHIPTFFPTVSCITIGIDENKTDQIFSIEPKLAGNSFNVVFGKTTSVILSIYDLSGKQIMKQNILNHQDIDISGLSTACYIVVLTDKSGALLFRDKLIHFQE